MTELLPCAHCRGPAAIFGFGRTVQCKRAVNQWQVIAGGYVIKTNLTDDETVLWCPCYTNEVSIPYRLGYTDIDLKSLWNNRQLRITSQLEKQELTDLINNQPDGQSKSSRL